MALMAMEIGGAETHVLELCKALQKKGMQVYVASNGGAYEPELAACGVLHYKVPLHNKQIYNIGGAYRALKRIITENDIRLVHAHARIPAFLCGILQRKLNFRFVTTAHWVFSTKFPYNVLSNWGEQSLAVSEDIKEYLIRHYRVPEKNIHVTINGIDTAKFSPENTGDDIWDDDIWEDFTIPDDALCVMSISRLDKDRSLAAHLLIEAAPVLYEQHPNMIICIIGNGDDYPVVKRKAEAMNTKLGKKVIVLPGSRVDVHNWLAISDVFVGASRAVLEAMAAGKPVVASGNEGYLGLLNEANLPIAVDTNFCYRGCGEASVGTLTNDILTLLNMPLEEREAMGAMGREFVLDNYSVDRMADDALALYNKIFTLPYPARVRRTDVMVSGYYGYNNSGDDLVLQSIVMDLKARRADLSITVLSRRPRETRSQYGVNAIYRFNLFSIWKLLRRTRLLITGGGSVIQDLTSTHSLIYYLWIIRTAGRLGVSNMLYANGIGPIRNAANINRVRRTLDSVELITLREEDSYALLRSIGVSSPRIHVTADAVFNLPLPDEESAITELAALGIVPGEFFCIAIRAWRYNPEGFEQQIATFADYVAEKYQYAILFILMRPSEDTEIAKKTMSLMKNPAILLETTDSLDSIRGVVGLSAFTLAMRLHTLIYAINQGVPVIGLDYDPKVQWLMKTTNQSFYMKVEEADANVLSGFADTIMMDRERISAEVKEAGLKTHNLAKQNVELCMKMLEER